MIPMIMAGACSVYNLADLKKRFSLLGFDVSFIDAPFMANLPLSSQDDKKLISFTAENFWEKSGGHVVVPLSEYWISQCIKKTVNNISSRALKASRSKEYLNDLLVQNNLDSLKIFKNTVEAESFVLNGGRIVVKPVGLHSGYGIEILDKNTISLLEKYKEEARTLKNRTLRIMEIENKGVMLTESLEGEEFSADAFWYKNVCHIVRLCKKRVILLQNKPCAAVYQLLEAGEEPKLEQNICRWMEMLFDHDNVSFGQFDFIRCTDGRVVPIDFASRVGGGITSLMRAAHRSYASWTGSDESDGETEKNIQGTARWTQFNYLPVTSGYVNIEYENYNLIPGHQEIFKKKGDYVISNPSSVGSRIATVVTQWPDSADKIPLDVIQSLLLDITTSKKL